MAVHDVVAAPPLPAGNRYALVIATSTHASAEYLDLEAPAQDAASMAALLGDPDVCGFDVRTLVDGTAAEIRMAMNAFFRDRGPDDLIVLYFSGHGDKDDRGRLHLFATDTDPETLVANGVSSRYLLDLSDAATAGRQVLILDCCFSGAFDAKGPALADLLATEAQQEDQISRGRCVLTASRGAQRSFQNRLPSGEVAGSVFTTALLEGIRSGQADVGNTGRITVMDAYRYAFAAVTKDRRRQNPQFNMRGAEGADIMLARNPVGVRVGAGLYELLAKVDSPYPDQRIEAVHALGDLLDDPNPAKAAAARTRLSTLARSDRDLAAVARQRLRGEDQAHQSAADAPPQRTARRSEPADEAPAFDVPENTEDTAEFIPADEEMGLFLPDDELAGLHSVEDPLGVFRHPPLDVAPTGRVAQFLFPTEKFRAQWRRHWSDPILGTAVAGLAAGRAFAPPTTPPLLPAHLWILSTAETARWCLVAVAILAGLHVLSWPFWHLSLSNKQLMLARGFLWRRTWAVSLDRITDVSLSQSPLAQLLDYGTLSFRVGRWRAHRIRHIPFPNDIWLRIVEERFEPEAVEGRLSYASDDPYGEV
jgi:hypothetical protein